MILSMKPAIFLSIGNKVCGPNKKTKRKESKPFTTSNWIPMKNI